MVMKDEQWDEVIAVNLTSTFMLMPCRRPRHAARPRPATAASSTSPRCRGVFGNPGQGNYAASKAGMIGMTKIAGPRGRLARHHRQLHRAGLHLHAHDRCAEREADRGDLQDDPGAALRHTGGDCRRRPSIWPATEAGYMTGQTLHVNGGMVMV